MAYREVWGASRPSSPSSGRFCRNTNSHGVSVFGGPINLSRHERSELGKSDYRLRLGRKVRMQRPSVLNSPFSAVRFIEELSRNVAKFSLFRSKTATFLWRPDCVAERAVKREPLSAKFPANREKYREFARFRPRNRTSISLNCTIPLRKPSIRLNWNRQ